MNSHLGQAGSHGIVNLIGRGKMQIIRTFPTAKQLNEHRSSQEALFMLRVAKRIGYLIKTEGAPVKPSKPLVDVVV